VQFGNVANSDTYFTRNRWVYAKVDYKLPPGQVTFYLLWTISATNLNISVTPQSVGKWATQKICGLIPASSTSVHSGRDGYEIRPRLALLAECLKDW